MTAVFLYGALTLAAPRAAVLGRATDPAAATLPGHDLQWTGDDALPWLVPAGGAAVAGLLLEATAEDLDRLARFAGGAAPRPVTLAGGRGALAYAQPVAGRGAGPAQPWRAGDWAPRWAATVAGAAADAMALLAGAGAAQDPAAVMARWPQMLVRAGARLRAEAGKPATLRRTAAPGDIEVRAARQPYARFFSVEEHDLAWRRFDGTMTPVVPRATFVSADAVIVLPYDPVRDRVLVIEQFRMGPFVRGDRQPWMLEPVAGRVDGGETPEEAAMRETQEEAGLVPRALVPGPSCYASPGAKTEYLYAFAAICDLPDGSAGLGGVEGETEDIRGHLMPFDRLMTLIDTGEVDLAPLIVLALWLDRRRAELRAAARGEADRLQAAG